MTDLAFSDALDIIIVAIFGAPICVLGHHNPNKSIVVGYEGAKGDLPMTTNVQIEANQLNAQLSTGPKTVNGKAIVATNAVKHGIFTKDIIVSSTRGKEDEGEYTDMLRNLVDCLAPRNQMESLLVEKIAVDFWRLRRVIRFESGSIAQYLETIFKKYYSCNKDHEKIDIEVQQKKDYIQWIATYSECLKREEVTFDQPIWNGTEIDSDILEDFHLIIKTLDNLSYEEREKLRYGNSGFSKLKAVVSQNGYATKEAMSAKLLEIYKGETLRLEREIKELEQDRIDNLEADKLNSMLGSMPQEDNTDKILKYERSIQKSIFQNILLLKKLQGTF